MRSIFTLFILLPLAAAEVPRPEFPQPQFQREQWLNLNGSWDFEFDDQDLGLSQSWESGARKFSRKIVVPYCFESKLSGIGDTSFHPWIWYRRTFSTPDDWNGKRVLLHFGAVDYRARVWVNGRVAGEHEGGNVPFTFDITPFLKTGGNDIVLRAEDPPTDRYIPRGKQFWELTSKGIFYTRTSGIWQTVWLEATGESYLERVKITPDNNGMVRFEGLIARPRKDLTLVATIGSEKQVIATALANTSEAHVTAGAAVMNPRLWSVKSPNLYDVTFELRQGDKILDRVQSYFGFRSVTVENGRVAINHRSTYLKMILDQGYWPDGILTPPTDEAIQSDIRVTKEMGFNGVRKHQKLEDPRFLYWADRMGLLVSSEMANAYLYDDDYARRFATEWTEAVERDINHPSIIIWVPINESWGTPDLHDTRQQNHLRAMYTLTHSLDATRLVIDNEGWEHTDMTDLFAVHDYEPTGQGLTDKYRNLGKPNAGVPDNGKPALAPGNTYNGTPVILSEFGGVAYIAPGSNVPRDRWGYAGVEKSAAAALERLRGIFSSIAHLNFAGYCYTQLTDVEQEINGLLTYDRKLKFDVKAIKAMNDQVN